MISHSIKISIVTATHNCVDTVAATCASVAEQSHSSLEHLLIDGASTDGTLEVLQRYCETEAVRVDVVSEQDGGIYHALNRGAAYATGEVVGVLHGDDFFADSEILASVATAFADPNIQAVYGDLEYVAQRDCHKVIRHWSAGPFSPVRLRYGWMPPHPTLFLRRSLFERFGVFDTTYHIAADYDFMLRVLKHLPSEQVAYMPTVFTRMRTGGTSNRSLSNIAQKSREDYRALRSNGVGGLGALFLKNARKLPQFWQR